MAQTPHTRYGEVVRLRVPPGAQAAYRARQSASERLTVRLNRLIGFGGCQENIKIISATFNGSVISEGFGKIFSQGEKFPMVGVWITFL
jgi:hypothetical protein